jgi:hypothetical protein
VGEGENKMQQKKKLLFFVFFKKNIYKSWLSRVRLTSKKIVYFTEEMLLRSITLTFYNYDLYYVFVLY